MTDDLFANEIYHIYLNHESISSINQPSIIEVQLLEMVSKKDWMDEVRIHGVPDTTKPEQFDYLLNQLLIMRESHNFEDWDEISFADIDFEINLEHTKLILDVTKKSKKSRQLIYISFINLQLSHSACLFFFGLMQSKENLKINFQNCKWKPTLVANIPVSSFSFPCGPGNGIMLHFCNDSITINKAQDFLKECQQLVGLYGLKLEGLEFSNVKNLSLEVLEQLWSFFSSQQQTQRQRSQGSQNKMQTQPILNLMRFEITQSTVCCKSNYDNKSCQGDHDDVIATIEIGGRLTIMRTAHKCDFTDVTVGIHMNKVTQTISRILNISEFSLTDCNVAMESLKNFCCNETSTVNDQGVYKILFKNCTFSSQTTIFPKIKEMKFSNNNSGSSVVQPTCKLTMKSQDSIIPAMELFMNEYLPFNNEKYCLDLSGNEINNTGMQHITTYLNKTKITKLNLSDTRLNNNHLIELCETLISNTKLTILDLSSNQNISFVGMKKLLHILQHDNTTLQQVLHDKPRHLSSLFYDSDSDDDSDGRPDDSGDDSDGLLEYISIRKKLNYYLQLNQMGRKYLLESHQDLSACLFALILKKAKDDPSCLYWLIQLFPHLISNNQHVGQKRTTTVLLQH